MPQANRAVYLDLFKTMLVWGMVMAHVIQLLGFRLGDGAARFSDFINLISFSGYMLAFGLGIGLSRGTRRVTLLDRVRPAAIILACFYMSSLAFVVLVERKPVTADLLVDLLTFRRLFGYSEFLASFFVLYVVIALVRPWLVAIGDNPVLLAVAIALGLGATYLTTDQLIPFAGTVIGHRRYASFPLLAYLPWFFVGIRIGRRDGAVGRPEFALAVVASATFAWLVWRAGFNLPERFPPTIGWVIGPALALLAYFVVATAVAQRAAVPSLLLAPGRHVLAALLVSNLVIFSIGRLWYKPAHPLPTALLIGLAILVVVTLWCAAIDLVGRRRQRPRLAAQAR